MDAEEQQAQEAAVAQELPTAASENSSSTDANKNSTDSKDEQGAGKASEESSSKPEKSNDDSAEAYANKVALKWKSFAKGLCTSVNQPLPSRQLCMQRCALRLQMCKEKSCVAMAWHEQQKLSIWCLQYRRLQSHQQHMHSYARGVILSAAQACFIGLCMLPACRRV
jgi:hypothetical protein